VTGVGVDLRRLSWCRSAAVWTYGAHLTTLEEDVQGAVDSDQEQLLAYVAREVASCCATIHYLLTLHPRPLPVEDVLPIVALQALPDETERADTLWRLWRGESASSMSALAELCRRAIRDAYNELGTVPHIIDERGRIKAMGAARDWFRLLRLTGEGGGKFLPRVGP
jgi:hypothetical protein